MATPPQLTIDTELYLIAVRALFELENGERKFAYSDGVASFSTAEALEREYRERFDDELPEVVSGSIRGSAMAVYLVDHHSVTLDEFGEPADLLDQALIDFVVAAAWAFLTAWTQRYGGVCADLIGGEILVDPGVRTPSG